MKHYWLLLRTTWHYATGMKGRLLLTYVFLTGASAVNMLEPYLLGKMVNAIQTGGAHTFHDVTLYLALFTATMPAYWLLHGPARIWEKMVSFHIAARFNEELFSIVTRLPMLWHRDHHSGETISKITKAAASLQRFSGDGFLYIETIVRFVSALAAILIIVPLYGMTAALLGGFIVFVIVAFDRTLIRSMNVINENGHTVSSALFDYVSNIVTVITLRLEDLAKNEYMHKIYRVLPDYTKHVRFTEAKWFLVSMLLSLTNFALLFLYMFKQQQAGDAILIGTLMALYQYVGRFVDVFNRLASQYDKLVCDATEVGEADSLITAYHELVTEKGTINIPDWNIIDIRHLNFRYHDTVHPVHHLSDVHLELKRGRKIALVGESGSGKSTILNLLRGLESPSSVQVAINKETFDHLHMLGNTTTLIPQNPEIFDNSIEYNITAGIEHTAEELMQACDLACFTPILNRLPDGLNTHIKERGVNLSGGEKQRLALARGIFAARESGIILLDEPTSSVDPKNEITIYRNLFERFSDRCIVSSIHHLHLLSHFDIIYLIDKGRVVEVGNFFELLDRGEMLKAMWKQYEESMAEASMTQSVLVPA